MRVLLIGLLLASTTASAHAQEARRRWELQRQLRLDKFDQVLPRAMRAHGIDMWIVAVKENHREPLWDDPNLREEVDAGQHYLPGLATGGA